MALYVKLVALGTLWVPKHSSGRVELFQERAQTCYKDDAFDDSCLYMLRLHNCPTVKTEPRAVQRTISRSATHVQHNR